jgi:hypothetical protein
MCNKTIAEIKEILVKEKGIKVELIQLNDEKTVTKGIITNVSPFVESGIPPKGSGSTFFDIQTITDKITVPLDHQESAELVTSQGTFNVDRDQILALCKMFKNEYLNQQLLNLALINKETIN